MNIKVKDFVFEITNDIKSVTPKRNQVEIISSGTEAMCVRSYYRGEIRKHIYAFIFHFSYIETMQLSSKILLEIAGSIKYLVINPKSYFNVFEKFILILINFDYKFYIFTLLHKNARSSIIICEKVQI